MVELAKLRQHRQQLEREWYLSPEGFLDHVRDFGAAPLAQEEPHGRIFREVWEGLNTKGKVILLTPRGSFKSQVFHVGFSAWMIDRNPNIRILNASETGKQAATYTGNIKEILEGKKHIEIFGDHAQRTQWSSHDFTTRQRNRPLKESTCTATGMEEVRTGMHYDIVLADDVVSQENTRTPEGMARTANWFGETFAQLDPGCWWLMPGTRHHFHDQYSRILQSRDLRALFHVIIHGYKYPDGKLFFPARITEQYVADQKKILGPKLWSAFYLNSPQSDETALFRQDQFHIVQEHEIPKNCYTSILTDFASGENKENDRTALFAVSLNAHRDAFVREVKIGRWLPEEALTQALLLYQKWMPWYMKVMTMEKTAHTEWAKPSLRRLAEQFGFRPVVVEIGGRSKESKMQRIQALQPRFSDGGRLFWSANIKLRDPDAWDLIVREFCEFPFSQHDDIPDALSDLDKQRDEGGFYVPAPPPNFNPARAPGAKQWRPTVVDGAWNSTQELDWRQMVKGSGERAGKDLWLNDASRLSPSLGSIPRLDEPSS